MRRPALFCDRDGTLIVDTGYPSRVDDVRLLPGAVNVLRAASRAGWLLILVSNQSGVGQGLVSPSAAAAVHARFEAILAQHDLRLDGAYYCFHAPDEGCACRKPAPGLLRRAIDELPVAVADSIAIGDRLRDVQAGDAIRCRAILIGDSEPAPISADVERCRDLYELDDRLGPLWRGT